MDRREVEVRQRMELTRTNRSAAYPQFWHRREAEDAGPAGSKCSTVRCALLLFSFEGMNIYSTDFQLGREARFRLLNLYNQEFQRHDHIFSLIHFALIAQW